MDQKIINITFHQGIKAYCKRGGGQGYRQQLKELKAQLKDIKEQQHKDTSQAALLAALKERRQR